MPEIKEDSGNVGTHHAPFCTGGRLAAAVASIAFASVSIALVAGTLNPGPPVNRPS